MKKKLLIILLFCYTFTNAQVEFEKGYFISNNGKKTECFIRNLDWMNTPTNFKYKIQLADSEIKTESIETTQEFSIDSECKYKRFKVKIDRANDDQKEINRCQGILYEKLQGTLNTTVGIDGHYLSKDVKDQIFTDKRKELSLLFYPLEVQYFDDVKVNYVDIDADLIELDFWGQDCTNDDEV